MIHKCAVGGCPNQSDTIIHYTLPEETSRRRQWVQFMRRGGKGVDISLSSRICGSHFSEDSFSKLDLGFTTRLILNVNAVPTIYPGDFTEAKKQHDVSFHCCAFLSSFPCFVMKISLVLQSLNSSCCVGRSLFRLQAHIYFFSIDC